MTEAPMAFVEQYTAALQAYRAGGEEEDLECAYTLGRQALVNGWGVLEMAAVYHQSLNTLLLHTETKEKRQALMGAAAVFFSESLSPFEMAQRGFQEAHVALQQLNASLERRADELNRTNLRLERIIEEQRQAEEQIRKLNTELENRAVELEAINNELEAFSYSVSHDLRAPLRSIDGFSNALQEDYADVLDERGKGYLQRVCTSTRRMAQLIDDLLGLSRVTRSEMRRETVDLSTLVHTIAADLQQTEPNRSVEWDITDGLTAKGDARLLQIALENLLGNAWKFTGKKEQARITFGATQDSERTVYFIRDNGAGFDSAYADMLFGAFQRLHSASEFPGTGIGLATVQRIVRRHGGQIWAESAVDQGATFYFTL
jgi:signal transduction histidine kinase